MIKDGTVSSLPMQENNSPSKKPSMYPDSYSLTVVEDVRQKFHPPGNGPHGQLSDAVQLVVTFLKMVRRVYY